MKSTQTEQLYVARIKNKLPPFKPQNGDIESGIIKTLEQEGLPLHFSSGKHRWIKHTNPPSPHHPEGSTVLWADQLQRKNPFSRIKPWNEQSSWDSMMLDTKFCTQTDEYLDTVQQNPEIRVYHFIGFPNQKEKNAVRNRKMHTVVGEFGAQSQCRAHIHIVKTVHPNHPAVSAIPLSELAKKTQIVQTFFDFAAKKSIQEFQSELVGFGSRVEYIQEVGTQKLTVPRTFFEFNSWQDALRNVFELKQSISRYWLDHAYAVCSKNHQFLNHVLSMRQTLSCIPVFALMRPSKIDQKQLKSTTKWLVTPFTLEIPSSMFGSGIVLNRK